MAQRGRIASGPTGGAQELASPARLVVRVVALGVALLWAPSAVAGELAPEFDAEEPVGLIHYPKHTSFEGGTGLLTLPAAELCGDVSGLCGTGEAAVAFQLRTLGKYEQFGFGAGITWALGLGSSTVRGADDPRLLRELSRSYFVVEGIFRYYLPAPVPFEWWLGASVGGVITNDSWSSKADRSPEFDTAFIGPRAVTLSTEGLSAGIQVGGNWQFARRWVLGTRIRYANWFFPEARETTPLGDPASLAGRVDVIDVGLTAGFLIPY